MSWVKLVNVVKNVLNYICVQNFLVVDSLAKLLVKKSYFSTVKCLKNCQQTILIIHVIPSELLAGYEIARHLFLIT